jgi:hypothetical protein
MTIIRRGADKSSAFPLSPTFMVIILSLHQKFIVLYMSDLNSTIVD